MEKSVNDLEDDEDNVSDDEYELYDETPEITAYYSKAYGPELLDSRLTASEKILLLWIRFRCGSDQNGRKVKQTTLAEDLGVTDRSIRRWCARLQELGFLSCIQNEPGKTSVKILRQPSKLYGRDRLENIFKYLKSNRKSADVDYIRSINLGGQICPPATTGQTDPVVTLKTGQPCPVTEDSRVLWHRTNGSYHDRDLSDQDLGDRDQDQRDRDRREVPGDSQDQNLSKDRKSYNTPLSEDPEGIARVELTKRNMSLADDRQADLAQKRLDKRRRVNPESAAQAKENKKELAKSNSMKSKWSWAKLEKEVWATLFQDHCPGINRSSWRKEREGRLAEKLIKDYGTKQSDDTIGIEIIRQAFAKLFEQWHFLKRKTFPYSKDPDKWVVPDFMFFDRPEAQQFMASIKIDKPKIVNRLTKTDDGQKSGLW